MIRFEAKNCNMVLTEKLQKYQYYHQPSGKTDKHEYLTGEEILPPDQSREVEQANFTSSPLEKAFEK